MCGKQNPLISLGITNTLFSVIWQTCAWFFSISTCLKQMSDILWYDTQINICYVLQELLIAMTICPMHGTTIIVTSSIQLGGGYIIVWSLEATAFSVVSLWAVKPYRRSDKKYKDRFFYKSSVYIYFFISLYISYS